jgi:poly(3-hydroxyalkanoate) depolymerase
MRPGLQLSLPAPTSYNCGIMTTDPDVRTVSVCGQSFRVAVRESTGPAPPLLLINGLGCSIEVFSPLLEALDPATGYVCFDAPGVGGSPRPRLPYRLSGLSFRLGKVLDELGIPEVDVLGASWGGALAQQFAFQHPRRCRRLILVSTGAAPILRPSLATLREAVSPRRFGNADIAAEFYGGKVREDPTLLRHLEREIPNRGGERFQTLAVLGWTSLLYLRWVRQPTLVLHGDADNLVPMLNARLLRRLLPNAQLHVFHDGHIGLITSATEIAPVIEAFRNGAQVSPAVA